MVKNEIDLWKTGLRGSGTLEWNGMEGLKSGLLDDTDGYVEGMALEMKDLCFELFNHKFVRVRLLVVKF